MNNMKVSFSLAVAQTWEEFRTTNGLAPVFYRSAGELVPSRQRFSAQLQHLNGQLGQLYQVRYLTFA